MGRGAAAWAVGTMKRAGALVALLAAGIVAPDAASAPLVVRAAFDTPVVQFGDAIRTHVVVEIDRRDVRTDSLRIVDDIAPLTPLGAEGTTRTVRGDTLIVAVDRTASCLSEACVAASGDATPTLARITVTATASDGGALSASAAWPALHVQGRVSSADAARSRPPFRADTVPAPPSYRLAPLTLGWLLDAGALVLGLGALTLGAYQVLLFMRAQRRAAPVEELARALRLAREAEERPEPDRRRALGLLARLLEARDRRLAATASDLAWSKPAPEREALTALVGDAEHEVAS
jgi:hypothetical protein